MMNYKLNKLIQEVTVELFPQINLLGFKMYSKKEFFYRTSGKLFAVDFNFFRIKSDYIHFLVVQVSTNQDTLAWRDIPFFRLYACEVSQVAFTNEIPIYKIMPSANLSRSGQNEWREGGKYFADGFFQRLRLNKSSIKAAQEKLKQLDDWLTTKIQGPNLSIYDKTDMVREPECTIEELYEKNPKLKHLHEEVLKLLVPFLNSKGFIFYNEDKQEVLALSFFRKFNFKIQIIAIQFDEYRPRFILEAGEYLIADNILKDKSAGELPMSLWSIKKRVKLYAGTKLEWFKLDDSIDAEKLLESVINSFPEIESWLENKKIGPHLKLTDLENHIYARITQINKISFFSIFMFWNF